MPHPLQYPAIFTFGRFKTGGPDRNTVSGLMTILDEGNVRLGCLYSWGSQHSRWFWTVWAIVWTILKGSMELAWIFAKHLLIHSLCCRSGGPDASMRVTVRGAGRCGYMHTLLISLGIIPSSLSISLSWKSQLTLPLQPCLSSQQCVWLMRGTNSHWGRLNLLGFCGCLPLSPFACHALLAEVCSHLLLHLEKLTSWEIWKTRGRLGLRSARPDSTASSPSWSQLRFLVCACEVSVWHPFIPYWLLSYV